MEIVNYISRILEVGTKLTSRGKVRILSEVHLHNYETISFVDRDLNDLINITIIILNVWVNSPEFTYPIDRRAAE